MQRNAYRKNRLDPSLSKRLADLPGWQWNPRDALWEEGFSHLLEYGKNHGHHNPTQAHTDEDGYNLGAWISQQRQAQRKGTLNEERAQRLSKLRDGNGSLRAAALPAGSDAWRENGPYARLQWRKRSADVRLERFVDHHARVDAIRNLNQIR